MKKPFCVFVAGLIALLVFRIDVARAQESNSVLGPFFGQYVGESISVVGEGLAGRDLNVEIERYKKDGFTLKWATVIHYTDGASKKKSHNVSFLPYRKRPGVYYSAVKKNVFHNEVPSDPLAGEPYVWANVNGNTMIVNALYITDNGGYELQTYKRTLDKNGLNLYFERIRNGRQLRLVTGRLERLPN